MTSLWLADTKQSIKLLNSKRFNTKKTKFKIEHLKKKWKIIINFKQKGFKEKYKFIFRYFLFFFSTP